MNPDRVIDAIARTGELALALGLAGLVTLFVYALLRMALTSGALWIRAIGAVGLVMVVGIILMVLAMAIDELHRMQR